MDNESPTLYIYFAAFVAALGSFHYGFHIGELNSPQKVISCEVPPPELYDSSFPPCIKMTPTQYALITSIFNLGGLLGSLLASRIADSKGRKWALLFNNIFLILGSLLMGTAVTYFSLVVGRVLAGIGSGVIVVVVPMYLSEISTPEYRGTFGVMNQLGIVTGILFSQVEGLYLSTVPGWRLILMTGAIIGLLQVILLGFVVESPRYLVTLPNGYTAGKKSLQKLRGTLNVESELNSWKQVAAEEGLEGLISRNEDDDSEVDPSSVVMDNESRNNLETPAVVFHARNRDHTVHDNINVLNFISNPHYRPALIVILLLQLTQQFSGINGVIFYSTTILSEVMPDKSDLVTVYISIVNTMMTIVSAILIDKAGRRILLLLSISSMSIASAVLGFSIIQNYPILSALSIITFVASFAIGLGPIPFLIAPEIVDTHAAATASGLGMTVNWISNFIVSFLFLGAKEVLGGSVFYFFTGVLIAAFFLVRLYMPETKGKTVEEIWKSGQQ
ncbi:7709_t:CDS:2 [Ambispora leptoticha]|uniref:7709_t:CDS:1 n=1 Tax=Ambispora leptoticha TaxID=144679 RepID=A0A9N9AN61_9GLOM|nr:7709_t:CDS:2 [Ambispora leptoticha]